MRKLIVIQQYFGLGDIIFAQSIAQDLVKDGNKVVWPVYKHLVDGLNMAYPGVVFVDHEKFNINYNNHEYKEIDGMLHLPMRYSEHLMGRQYKFHMVSKYEYLGKDWKEWRKTIPTRDYQKEDHLFRDILEIKPDEPYNFISNDFGSDSARSIQINVNNGLRNVYLKKIDGYSLFDWVKVMQLAATIHAVSSSTLYLFELFPLTASEIHLYPRKPIENDFTYTQFVMTKPYILHE